MKRQFVFAILVVLCLVLTACGGGVNSQANAASENDVEENLAVDSNTLESDGTTSTEDQTVQFPTPDSALTDPANAKLRYLLSNVQLAKTEEGWSHYFVSAAVQNLTSEFLNVDSEAEEPVAGMTYYYLPGFEAFGTVETQEGNSYPVFPAFDLNCETGIGDGMYGAWSFKIPPEATITKAGFGCLGLYYKVPETLHPARLALSLGGQMKETFDIASLPATRPAVHNSFPQAITLPVTYKIGPFELAFRDQVTSETVEYKQVYFINGQVTNMDMTADSKWEYDSFEMYGFSELGDGIGMSTGLLFKATSDYRSRMIGPGQSEEVAFEFYPMFYYQFEEESYYWFFFNEDQWKVFKVNLLVQ